MVIATASGNIAFQTWIVFILGGLDVDPTILDP
jgi:hypothetical protein